MGFNDEAIRQAREVQEQADRAEAARQEGKRRYFAKLQRESRAAVSNWFEKGGVPSSKRPSYDSDKSERKDDAIGDVAVVTTWILDGHEYTAKYWKWLESMGEGYYSDRVTLTVEIEITGPSGPIMRPADSLAAIGSALLEEQQFLEAR
jgi:hypothetical protein